MAFAGFEDGYGAGSHWLCEIASVAHPTRELCEDGTGTGEAGVDCPARPVSVKRVDGSSICKADGVGGGHGTDKGVEAGGSGRACVCRNGGSAGPKRKR